MHYLFSCFSYEKIVDTGVMILLIAYLSDILWKNLNVLVYANLLKYHIYHNIRTVILALDYPTCVGFFMHSDYDRVSSFYSKRKYTGWNVWMQNRSDSDEVFIRPGNRPSDMTEAEIKCHWKLCYDNVQKIE